MLLDTFYVLLPAPFIIDDLVNRLTDWFHFWSEVIVFRPPTTEEQLGVVTKLFVFQFKNREGERE